MTHFYAHRFVALAHRGGYPAKENSLAAFQHAANLGYRFFETDVHATKDGVLAAFHDDKLDRVTNKTGLIKDLHWAEIADARIANSEPIPLFEELLAAFPDSYFNVDIKAPAAIKPLADLCQSHNIASRLCVTSFSAQHLNRFRKATSGQVVTSASWPGILSTVLCLPSPGPAIAYQVPVAHKGIPIVTKRFIERAHTHGRVVHVWTINDRTEMERLIDLGVDGIVTDETELLRTVLEERGLW